MEAMYLGVKRPEREYNHSTRRVIIFKNEWSRLSTDLCSFVRHAETDLYVTSNCTGTDRKELKLLIWMYKIPSGFSN